MIGAPIMLGGWSMSLYILHYAWTHFTSIMMLYKVYVISYFVSCFFFFKNTVPCSYHSLSHSWQPFFPFLHTIREKDDNCSMPRNRFFIFYFFRWEWFWFPWQFVTNAARLQTCARKTSCSGLYKASLSVSFMPPVRWMQFSHKLQFSLNANKLVPIVANLIESAILFCLIVYAPQILSSRNML